MVCGEQICSISGIAHTSRDSHATDAVVGGNGGTAGVVIYPGSWDTERLYYFFHYF